MPKPGYKQTPEHREKRIAALRGRQVKVEVNYFGAHARARKFLAGASCVRCGATPVDMALKRDAPPETMRTTKTREGWVQRWSVAFPPDLAYMPLCAPCHVEYDTEGGSWTGCGNPANLIPGARYRHGR